MLIVLGYILFIFDKIKKVALKRYITYKVSKLKDSNIIGIGESTRFLHLENITIGNGTYINGGDICASKHAKIVIGENCLISYNVHIRTDMHIYKEIDVPINKQGVKEKDIIIENNVWIGYGAQIMPGVTIGTGSIVGAGAIVTRDVPSYKVVGGIPAEIIKSRE